jgi:spore photoproduct lyase
MFERIFVERHLKDHPRFLKLKDHFPLVPLEEISKVEDVWGKVKKPYLQKRESLQLFVGEKKGQKVKIAPPAYAGDELPHYYFVHAYNCIYECQYCYLQGYFKTPDLVLFINHEEIISEMEETLKKHKTSVWFHAGEFSDSLALTHLTDELKLYRDFLERNPLAKIEFRTKSVNVKKLLELLPHKNMVISFSLSPEYEAKTYDIKTPSLKARLTVMKDLYEKGFSLALHLDPIVYAKETMTHYQEFLQILIKHVPLSAFHYISLGVVRFTGDVFHEVKKNYPKSPLWLGPFTESFDGKKRYPKPLRGILLNGIKKELIKRDATEEQIYFCME